MSTGEHDDSTQAGPASPPGGPVYPPGGQPPYPPGGQPPPYPPYGYYPPPYALPRHPDAMTALVLGAASLVVFPPLGPFAWHIGARVGREIASSPGRWSGDDLAKIGMVLGMVGTALCALFLLFFIMFFGIGLSVLGLSLAVIGSAG
jgi:hypothetical protein